jgi:hypothetical protein
MQRRLDGEAREVVVVDDPVLIRKATGGKDKRLVEMWMLPRLGELGSFTVTLTPST